MLSSVVIVGNVYKAPRRVNAMTVVFQVLSRTGDYAPRPIVFHVSASGALTEQALSLKLGIGVFVEASFKTTAQGNPQIHTYPDGEPYARYEVIAETITMI